MLFQVREIAVHENEVVFQYNIYNICEKYYSRTQESNYTDGIPLKYPRTGSLSPRYNTRNYQRIFK